LNEIHQDQNRCGVTNLFSRVPTVAPTAKTSWRSRRWSKPGGACDQSARAARNCMGKLLCRPLKVALGLPMQVRRGHELRLGTPPSRVGSQRPNHARPESSCRGDTPGRGGTPEVLTRGPGCTAQVRPPRQLLSRVPPRPRWMGLGLSQF